MSRLWWFLAFVVTLIGVLGVNRFRYDLSSYALLRRFSDPQANGILLRSESHPVRLENVSIPVFGTSVLARLYRPGDITSSTGARHCARHAPPGHRRTPIEKPFPSCRSS